MCRPGDIIIVSNFKDELGSNVDKHSFIVVDNKKYITSNMMCSFHDDIQKEKKLKYYGNYEIDSSLIIGKSINTKNGYIKIDKLYYFDKDKTDYRVIAHIDIRLLNKIYKNLLGLSIKGRLKLVDSNIKI